MNQEQNASINYAVMGAKIRSARREKKMTQGQVAQLCGISPAFFGHIERGTRIASVETLVTIARILKVSVDSLVLDDVAVLQDDRSDMGESLTSRSNDEFGCEDTQENYGKYYYTRIEKSRIEALARTYAAITENVPENQE